MFVLNLITFANLFILFSLLFFKKDNAFPNKILALILIDPAINFLSNVNTLAGNFAEWPYVFFFAQITCYFFAPLVHIYVNLLIGKKINLYHPLYIISSVFTLLTVYFGIEFMTMTETEQASYIHGLISESYPWQMVVVNSLFIIMQQVYFTVAAIQVYQYRRKISNLFSNYDKTQVDYVTKFILLIWILNFITIGLYATLPMIEVEYIYLPIVVTIIYFFILYFSFHYHSIFTRESYEKFLNYNRITVRQKEDMREENDMNMEEMQSIMKKVEEYICAKELFLNPDLSIHGLSKEINISSNKLSTAINKVSGSNFNDLINSKRVEKSRQLLKTENNMTIEGIAFESGFNSRASFYRAFKKYMGQSPSEFLENTTIKNGKLSKS